jgi:hypothetical protein
MEPSHGVGHSVMFGGLVRAGEWLYLTGLQQTIRPPCLKTPGSLTCLRGSFPIRLA